MKWMSETPAQKVKLEAAKTRKQKSVTINMYIRKNHEVKRSCWRNKKRRIEETARESSRKTKRRKWQ